MKLRIWLPIVVVLLLAVGLWQAIEWRNQPPVIASTTAIRQTITSAVSTNGMVEPSEWAVARAEASGTVTEILVGLNQRVSRGQPILQMDDTQARADMEAARARIAQIQAEIEVMDAGGPAAERAAINGDIENLRTELAVAERNRDRERRLEAQQASTRAAVAQAEDRVEQIQQQIAALQQRRDALVTTTERTAAEARLRDATAAAEAAINRLTKLVVRAPVAGTIYEFDLKPGAFLNPGQEVASIGQLDQVHVKIFVDEPDLGRVQVGKPVTITWDALPGREWDGEVNRTATQIVERETRKVGEVLCVIDNADHTLIPGTNVNVVIQSETAENAVTVPKESLFREDGQLGVYVVVDDGEMAHLEWRTVTQGVNNVTRTQVTGISEGDQIALPGSVELSEGMIVQTPE